jgi:predicted helicase
MRQRRGVYYTPEPVVSYIVRSIDHLLKTRFDRPMGLADEKVMILDPACGTGTFLYFVIQEIHDTVVRERGEGAWNSYVREKLLGRIFGFELLMAPYAIAHMKLALQLQELGYDFQGEERLGIYLTNSLEEAITKAETLGFARFISEEADAASEIKRDKPIMVVLGNPPYSVSSANKGEHIERLMERYKQAVRSERNIQPLSDDYIKFIRFAHDRIERTGYGIVGIITNNAYLSGLIHRGMRWQ